MALLTLAWISTTLFFLLCAFIIFYHQNLISCVCCLITANGQFSLGWVGPTFWTPPHRWRHRENATLLFESWTTANLSTLCTPEHPIIEQAAKGGTLLWLHGLVQSLISGKEIYQTFRLPLGWHLLIGEVRLQKPTTRMAGLETNFKFNPFWECLQLTRNMMFSEGAHSRCQR